MWCIELDRTICKLSLYVEVTVSLPLLSAPNGSPQNPTALTVSSTAIQVQWEQVPEVLQNGDITRYEIRVYPAKFQAMSNIIVLSPSLNMVISGLEEYVDYTFAIRAYTKVGSGPFSGNTTNRTNIAG